VELEQLLRALAIQTLPPSKIIFSVTDPRDLPPSLPPDVGIAMGSKGLTTQRNRGMALVKSESDFIAFFDDDYLPSTRTLEGIAALFAAYPGLAGADGHLLADGVRAGGIAYEDALRLLEAYDRDEAQEPHIKRDACGLYGCNMVFRSSAIEDARFDEDLPLYGWQEDIDFSNRLVTRGRIVKSAAFAGVHRGVKGARTSGLKFGYSQIVNPVYLVRKGTMPISFAARLITHNVAANHLKMLKPEPWIDRWGRTKGNWLALAHILTNRADPRHVLKLS
jgi:GT2 family glycosyltransferase